MERFTIPAEKKNLDPTLKKILFDLGGPEAHKIATVLLEIKEDVTDEKLADLSKVKLNIVRKILYILNENHLTEFSRVRDKRSGWFVYFWRQSFDNLESLLKERRADVIDKLEKRMHFEEQNYFFRCDIDCKERFVFMDALELNFKCPHCEQGKLVEDKNSLKVELLKKTIVKLRSD